MQLGRVGLRPQADGVRLSAAVTGSRPGVDHSGSRAEGTVIMGDEAERAALFDMDGTLVDTNYLHAVSWWEAFR